jgi:hypothetical protein
MSRSGLVTTMKEVLLVTEIARKPAEARRHRSADETRSALSLQDHLAESQR